MGTVIAWLLEKLTSKIALPIMAVMLVANIGTGIALEITRITLQHRTEDLAAEKATHAADIATYQAATAQAKALDQQHALTVKEGQDQVTTEKQHDLENQLASARAVAANFVRQHPAPAVVPSGRDNPPVPAAPDAPGSVDRAPGSTVIPATDADACAIAYTVAVGWQDWWKKEQPLWQAGAAPSVAADGAVVPIVPVRADGIDRPVDLLAAVTIPQVVAKERQPQDNEKNSQGESDRE